MKIALFEDNQFDALYPLAYVRPVFELRCGRTLLHEKVAAAYPGASVVFFCRDYLAKVFAQRTPGARVNDLAAVRNDRVLFLNGRILVLGKAIPADGPDEVGFQGDTIVYARVSPQTLSKVAGNTIEEILTALKASLPNVPCDATLIGYPWDLINNNPKAIEHDFTALDRRGIEGKFHSMSCVYGEEKAVWVAPTAEVHPMVVLDTRHGPVIIDEGAIVFPHTRIEGPCAVGRDSQIVGGKIREGCSIGPVCRVGGEVEESIIHAFSNKYHDGFLGHAYVGEWVNLGGITTNSDLKNDYSTVQVYVRGQLMDSGSTKVGSFIGDHTKTSIGTYLNTGTVLGVGCNILASGGVLTYKYIPSFCWFFNNHLSKGYGQRQMIETARIVFSRRKQPFTDEDARVLGHVFDLTKEERTAAIKKSRKESGVAG
mgnify:CR=1 FL=1